MKRCKYPHTDNEYKAVASLIYNLTHDTWENWIDTDYILGILSPRRAPRGRRQIIIYTSRDGVKYANIERMININYLLNDAGPDDDIDELMQGEYNRSDCINEIVANIKKQFNNPAICQLNDE